MRFPALKFTVRDCDALKDGNTLETLQCTSSFEVKIVKIGIFETERTDGQIHYCPDAKSELKPGYVCWILPHLQPSDWLRLPHLPDQKDPKDRKMSNDPEMTDFVNAYETIYKITLKVPGQKCFKGKAVEAVGQKLKEFMKQFALEDGDLQLDELSCHDQRYAYEHETAASICTEPVAKRQLQHLIKSDPQCLEDLRIKKESGYELLALDMRKNFKISPIGIVHNRTGLLEIPETTSTILSKGDQLVFLMQDDPTNIKNRMHKLNKGDHEFERRPLPPFEKCSEGAAVLKIKEARDPPPLTPPKKRRGGKGGKSQGKGQQQDETQQGG